MKTLQLTGVVSSGSLVIFCLAWADFKSIFCCASVRVIPQVSRFYVTSVLRAASVASKKPLLRNGTVSCKMSSEVIMTSLIWMLALLKWRKVWTVGMSRVRCTWIPTTLSYALNPKSVSTEQPFIAQRSRFYFQPVRATCVWPLHHCTVFVMLVELHVAAT